MNRFGETRFKLRKEVTSAIASLGLIGWTVTEMTEYKISGGWSASVDFVCGMSNAEQDIRSMNLTFVFKDDDARPLTIA